MKKNSKIMPLLVVLSFLFATLHELFIPTSNVHADAENLIKNAGFESGIVDWSKSGSAGVASNNVKSGKNHAWLDPGSSNTISQQVTIPVTGSYNLSAWFSTGGPGGKLGVKKVGGSEINSVTTIAKSSYTRYEIPNITLGAGDQVEVYVTGGNAQTNWVNVDEFELLRDDTKSVNLAVNPGFESGLGDWAHSGQVGITTIAYNNTVSNAVYIEAGSTVFQKIKVPLTGNYKLSALLHVEEAGGSFGVKRTDGTDLKSVSVTTSVYKQHVVTGIQLHANDEVEIYLSSANKRMEADNFNFQFDFDDFPNTAPLASNVSVSGNAWTEQKLVGSYTFMDPDGHKEGATRFRWLVSDTRDGVYNVINGQVSKTFVSVVGLKGKYVRFEVTPVDLFGKEGQAAMSNPIGPLAENLIINSNFDAAKQFWRYDGAFTYKAGDNVIAYLDPGAASYLSQTVTVPDTGYYKLQALFNMADENGAKFGIRFPEGSNIKSGDVPKSSVPVTQMLNGILLEKGAQVEVYFTGINANDKWVEIDDSYLLRDTSNTNPLPELSNIVSFTVPNQVGVSRVDGTAKKVSFKVPYGSKVNAIAPQITVSDGAYVTPSTGKAKDFTNPVTYTVKGKNGTTQLWTVECSVADKEITIDSSNAKIKDAFNWAKPKAKSYVRTGKQGLINRDETFRNSPEIKEYMPSYWAGYAHRYAFYSRDMAHQMAGAHLLGLDRENFSMLKAFAGTANETHKWYPAWALNFDGSIFKLDYRNANSFVREVPAVFELVEKAYDMYLWTGDKNYLTDATLWTYYDKAMTDFITLHDGQIKNGVAEGTGKGIFDGAASYDERNGEAVVEAGDGIASQYQALLAYANLSKEKGDMKKYQEFKEKARAFKKYFNTDWGVKGIESGYVRGYEAGGKAYSSFGKEASWFMPMKQITEAGERTDQFLGLIDSMSETPGQAPVNIEAFTYLPDTFFPYGKNELGWKWMKYIIDRLNQPHEISSQGTNGDYPEVSYTLISQTVEGLMGITPIAPDNKLSTLSRLPQDIQWLELNHISLGDHDVYLRHDGATKSTLRNNSGTKGINWEAQFAGSYRYIQVNGAAIKAETKTVNGVAISYAEVKVPVGHSVTAIPSNKKGGHHENDDQNDQ